MFQHVTELGIRGLAVLLELEGEGPVQSREIAARLGVSATYVTKAFQPLARHGWLHSTRGRTGGWEVVVEPQSVTLADVVLALEPNERWRRCSMGNSVCSDETACPFHAVWGEARERFAAVMKTITLDEFWRFAPAMPSPSRRVAKKTKKTKKAKKAAKKAVKKAGKKRKKASASTPTRKKLSSSKGKRTGADPPSRR